MANKQGFINQSNKVKTYRWLFYLSILPIICLFVFPIIVFPIPLKSLFPLELLAALTIGVLFAFIFLLVNIICFYIDKRRKFVYVVGIIFSSAWILWAVISWKYIQYMDYLLH